MTNGPIRGMMLGKGGDTMDDRDFMEAALALAREAADAGEVPVGCVIVRNGEIVGRGRNRREEARNALAHAEIEAIDHIKIAVCGTPVKEKTAPQVLREDHVVLKLLGRVPFQRETSFIIDGNSNAKVLTIGEAYCTEGNWAGFPPHKHDEDNMPAECIAEEIYYFLFDPKQGFAVQCLYTADGALDEAYRVKNDELVEFPYGYHTTVSTPGYQTYFLWLMAGDYQGFNRSNDPEHDWVK